MDGCNLITTTIKSVMCASSDNCSPRRGEMIAASVVNNSAIKHYAPPDPIRETRKQAMLGIRATR